MAFLSVVPSRTRIGLTTNVGPAWRLGRAILFVLVTLAARAQAVDEDAVKAAYLYNFAKFVVWPPQTFKSPTDPIAICILGPDPFGDVLNATVSGKTVAGRRIVVRQVSDSQPLTGCAILFVSASEAKRFRSIASRLQASGVLSVGETEGFAAEGGVINFKLVHGNIRLEINIAAAECAHVQISSKLLSLAQIVGRAP
jgi:hypothetical protein